ncbi:preprotein translocase subunit SecY [Streptomyces sp. CHA1]|uniref:Preprotein translocase subunit SecY n=8 Tax=Streptomyces TaxID=1883 RepID=A0ACC7XXR7_9ACTN|nr:MULTISPECIES: preprotein translocase subunit SecY [Streptomyces]MBZ2409172.1 preprotein translocase subunit SecY [Streptomyces sp. L06]MYQ75051.1 preprotein translocase subunit SecY [Streptomyces sp. SID4934]MYW61063.1 preprotein translocase subunit SecY [Streptomyces sp. SID8370]MYW84831.1 preprotein translocase subunit SecY [Streptomyces sp. SID8371]MYX49568.1 preprotein translocase subunit SecY [Streptomyces sp. SID8385]MYX86664.1 preprotein translocase subunit SecY [Streptomyces sp. SI
MLTAFARAFKTPDLRKKLLFTLGIIVLYRIGAHVPIPGVSYQNVQICMDQANATQGLFGLVNMFSGGALLQITIFALGIMPYITASIILQLLTVVIPRLEALKKEGSSGQAKITQYTRYLTVALAVLQGTGLVATARSGSLFQGCPVAGEIVPDQSIFVTAVMILTMTAGTALVMWLGELITDRGIGNGMSILMFISIAASFPASLWAIKEQGDLAGGWIEFGTVILVGLAMVGLVVFVEQAQRRIPVQYAKRMIGRRSYGGTSTYIPLKVNQAGVIPVIFASSLLYIPALIVQFSNSQAGWAQWINNNLADTGATAHVILYFFLIVFFAFFYVAISFNPEEVADNMKKYGGFIPGIRAGRPTAEYLSYVLNRITWPGSLYLGLIALVPTMALAGFGANQNFPFGGTSILIIVGVGLETVKQIESQLQQRNYEGFLR